MTVLAAPRRLTGRAVLAMLLAFFGVVAAVNAVFILLALQSFSGVSAEGAYQRGLAWNRELAAADAQRSRNWSVQVEAVRAGDVVRLRVVVADAMDRPLDGLALRAALRRPASRGHDVAVELGAAGRGSYAAEAALPMRGQWDLRLEVERADGAAHVLEKRLWLP